MRKNQKKDRLVHRNLLTKIFALVAFISLSLFTYGQDYILPLYPGEIPNSIHTGQKEKMEKKDIVLISNVQNPDITVSLSLM